MVRIEMENGEGQQWLGIFLGGGRIRKYRHGRLVLHSDLEDGDYPPGGVVPPASKPWVWNRPSPPGQFPSGGDTSSQGLIRSIKSTQYLTGEGNCSQISVYTGVYFGC